MVRKVDKYPRNRFQVSPWCSLRTFSLSHRCHDASVSNHPTLASSAILVSKCHAMAPLGDECGPSRPLRGACWPTPSTSRCISRARPADHRSCVVLAINQAPSLGTTWSSPGQRAWIHLTRRPIRPTTLDTRCYGSKRCVDEGKRYGFTQV